MKYKCGRKTDQKLESQRGLLVIIYGAWEEKSTNSKKQDHINLNWWYDWEIKERDHSKPSFYV